MILLRYIKKGERDMSRTTIPWTLEDKEPKVLKEKREEMQLKEIQNKVDSNSPVSVAKIVAFLNENKNKCFTNKQISAEVGISGSTVAGIMDKLEEIGCVKIAKIRKNISSGISQVYQSNNGSSTRVEKEREVEGYITKVFKVFSENINKTYSKKDVASELGISADKVGQAFSVLLVTHNIKVVGEDNGSLLYQHIKGSSPLIEVSDKPSSSYITLNKYVKMNNIKDGLKNFKADNKHSRLFYSNKGIVTEYEISYLQKVLGNSKTHAKKKSLLEKIKIW